MALLQIHDGRVKLGDLRLTFAELKILRPEFPQLHKMIVSLRYDGTTHIMSDGKTQRSGPVPWAAGDALLADEDNIARDLLELRNVPDVPNPGTTDSEMFDQKVSTDPVFKALLKVVNNSKLGGGTILNARQIKTLIVGNM